MVKVERQGCELGINGLRRILHCAVHLRHLQATQKLWHGRELLEMQQVTCIREAQKVEMSKVIVP